MKFCNDCGACIADDILECPHCGSEDMVATMPQKPKETVAEEAPAEAEADNTAEVTVAEDTAEAVEEPGEEADRESVEESAEEREETEASAEDEAESEEVSEETEDHMSDEEGTAEAEETKELDETEEAEESEAEEKAEESEEAENSDEEETAEESEKPENSEEAEDSSAKSEEGEPAEEKTELSPEEMAAKKARKKKIAIIVGSVLGAVAVVVAVICVFTFVDFDRNRAYDLKEKTFVADENVTGDPVAPIPFVSNPPYEMSESFSDYQLNINGAVYQVPMPVQEIIDSGWAFGDGENSEKILAKEETADTYFVSKDGAVMYATIINFNNADTALNKCYVSRLRVDYSDNLLINVFMTGNLSLGRATRDQIEKLIGESSDVVELVAGTVVTYKNSDKAKAVLTYNKKTKVLEGIEYVNTKKPYNYQETTLPPTTNEYGGTEVTKPTELGKDITSGVVQIQGDIYQLPIKVSEFLNNGWEITFKEDRAILYAGEHLFATLTKDDVTITGVDVHNSSKDEKLIRNCEVIAVSSSPEDKYEVVFPGNLKIGTKDAELKSLIQGKEYEFNEVNFDEYVFHNGAYTLMIVVDKDESAVNYISMTYDKENLNKAK